MREDCAQAGGQHRQGKSRAARTGNRGRSAAGATAKQDSEINQSARAGAFVVCWLFIKFEILRPADTTGAFLAAIRKGECEVRTCQAAKASAQESACWATRNTKSTARHRPAADDAEHRNGRDKQRLRRPGRQHGGHAGQGQQPAKRVRCTRRKGEADRRTAEQGEGRVRREQPAGGKPANRPESRSQRDEQGRERNQGKRPKHGGAGRRDPSRPTAPPTAWPTP